MSLSAGERLGPYEIVNALGAGGMGEVYRARDTNLNRVVALKILPESFAADADRVARVALAGVPARGIIQSVATALMDAWRKSLTFATARITTNLWLMDGVDSVRVR